MGCAFGSGESEDDTPQKRQGKPKLAALAVDGDGLDDSIIPFEEGVKVVSISDGDGKTFPQKGDELTMHYVGKFHGGHQHGETFDSSRAKGRPFTFKIGLGMVVKGWDEGVMQMSLGQKANLEVSWHYGYGQSGRGPIPPEQDMLFEVELIAIN
ncbi:MAG: FKBP-type peptidyl-prolyl cis-trans isomerase [Herbaspirillum sp.]|nr:FKBP-type peptidyl-prolyl cis-trans isomerase [Herbaspirillum sp.]